tara:strand:+ start:1017 stop:1235 length:219 start_codon:yes stop_codon:yes gene_type:complete
MTKKYMVIKKCYANDFMLVSADSPEQAIEKASENDGKSVMNHLEFDGYQPTGLWKADEFQDNGLKYTKTDEL